MVGGLFSSFSSSGVAGIVSATLGIVVQMELEGVGEERGM